VKRRRDSESVCAAYVLPASAWRRRLRERLLRWFAVHARELPWRPSPGLYATWISEIMLQQTQVATVIPYYNRFLQRFPHVGALAAADEQEVLRHWEGLGYYRRARQLHAAARRIVEQHQGQLPTSLDEWRGLPGIGRYTAGAILSIALDQRHPILEANSVRVLSRLLALDADPACRNSQHYLWAVAEALVPRRRCGDFNQALMELGSMLCTPRTPQCACCPVATLCPTQARGLQEQVPRPKSKTTHVTMHEAAIIVRHADGRVLLRCCQAGERWEGLWDFPRVELSSSSDRVTDEELRGKVAALTGVAIDSPRVLAMFRHGVTRYRITLTCYAANCRRNTPRRAHVRWVTPSDIATYPLNVTARQISRLLADDSQSKGMTKRE
jgi:A/G-specific adenine glycosylase